MLWIALHPPALSLEAFCATLQGGGAGGHAAQPAVALMAAHRITAANAAALQRGVQPGLKRATALALVGDLLLGQADAQRDTQALHALAHAALAFTPSVTLEGADATSSTVLLEVQGSLRYFGGLTLLLQRLRDALAPLGHRLCIATAPTALGAAMLSRWREGLAEGAHSTQLKALQNLLDAAPVWLLGPGREHWEALQGMGLHTLSDLRQLPRAGLARRFGDSLLDALDRARGEQPDPRAWLSCPSTFEARLELFARADSTEQVLYGATVLLARLVAWARAQRSRVVAFVLSMRHESRHREGPLPATELRIELAVPSDDAHHLQTLLRERLANCQLAAPTLELRLRCHQLARGEAPSGELFPTRQSQSEGLTRLVERLRARLGDAQVQCLQPLQDHRPEHAGRPQAVQLGAHQHALTLAVSSLPLHHPVWLLPRAQPLPEQAALPLLDGQPLQLLAGPERIEAGWWQPSDGHPDHPHTGLATRDYFIAQTVDGALVWLYRTRLPAAAAAHNAGWFLHGRFG
jgi:protein ImuB